MPSEHEWKRIDAARADQLLLDRGAARLRDDPKRRRSPGCGRRWRRRRHGRGPAALIPAGALVLSGTLRGSAVAIAARKASPPRERRRRRPCCGVRWRCPARHRPRLLRRHPRSSIRVSILFEVVHPLCLNHPAIGRIRRQKPRKDSTGDTVSDCDTRTSHDGGAEPLRPVGAENSVTSCDLQILVEKAAEPVSS